MQVDKYLKVGYASQLNDMSRFVLRSHFVGFVAFVEALQEGAGSSSVELVSSVVVEMVDSVVAHVSLGRHEIFVEIACVGHVPFCLVETLIAEFDQEVNSFNVGDSSIGAEMVSHEDFGLFGSRTVLAASRKTYISWILSR